MLGVPRPDPATGGADLARQFRGAKPPELGAMLEALAALGQARGTGGGRYVAYVWPLGIRRPWTKAA